MAITIEEYAWRLAVGQCTSEGCDKPRQSGVLPRCREHAGVFGGVSPLPAQAHRTREAQRDYQGGKS